MEIEGPLLIGLRRFTDLRGTFIETYSERDFHAVGVADRFVQDNHSFSIPAGTLRGLHFQLPPRAQAKLVRVVRGAILDVAVDIRRGSPAFGRHVAYRLEAGGTEQLYIPAGFAHGFLTLEPDTEVAYKVSDTYAPECDRGIAWNDPDLGLPWAVQGWATLPWTGLPRTGLPMTGLPWIGAALHGLPDGPVLSDKDRLHPRLRDLPPAF